MGGSRTDGVEVVGLTGWFVGMTGGIEAVGSTGSIVGSTGGMEVVGPTDWIVGCTGEVGVFPGRRVEVKVDRIILRSMFEFCASAWMADPGVYGDPLASVVLFASSVFAVDTPNSTTSSDSP